MARIDRAIKDLPEDQRNMKSMGRIIGILKKEFGDAADMSIASKFIKSRLS